MRVSPGSGAYDLPTTLSRKGIKSRPEDKMSSSTKKRSQAFSADSRIGPGSYNPVSLVGNKQRALSTIKNNGIAIMPKAKRPNSISVDKGIYLSFFPYN